MRSSVAARFVFGNEGNAGPLLGEGWSNPEPGFVWTVGQRSTLRLPLPATGRLAIRIAFTPFLHPGQPSQRVDVTIDGHPAGGARVGNPTSLTVLVGPGARDGTAMIELAHPDAGSPAVDGGSDTRVLGLAVSRLDVLALDEGLFGEALALHSPVRSGDTAEPRSLPLAELVSHFESVGDNCEFGLVQRRCGAEPLGLFRFASIRVADLLRGLDTGFEGMGEADTVRIASGTGPDPEWMVRDPSYDLHYHTFIPERSKAAQQVIDDEVKRLGYLRRRFLDTVANGDKMLVLKRDRPIELAEALSVLLAARARGDAALLYVVRADAGNPPGSVVALSPHLYRGHVARFAPGENAHDLDLEPWIAVCANAHMLRGTLRGYQHG